jgi:hypothetical protein
MASDHTTSPSHHGVPIAINTTSDLLSETTRNSNPSVRRQILDRPHGTGVHSTSLPSAPPSYSSLSYEIRDLWGEAAKKLTPYQLGILKFEDIPSNNSRSSTPALATLKGVLAIVDEQAKKKQAEKWKKRWYSLVKSMKRFNALVQAGLDFDPTPYGALVWQVVSFGIEASINNSDIQDLVYESCEYLKGIVDEYVLYEARYLDPPSNGNGPPLYQTSLMVAVISVYATVLKYAAELRYYLSHKLRKWSLTGAKRTSDMGIDQIHAALSGLETPSLSILRQNIEEKRKTSCDILSNLQNELSDAQISAMDRKVDNINNNSLRCRNI